MKDLALKLFVILVAVFAPAKAMLLTALVLVVADLVTGMWASLKAGESLSSAKLKTSVLKIVVYELAIGLGYLAQAHLTGEAIPVASIVSGFVGLTEMLSVTENLNRISGGTLLSGLVNTLNSKK